MKHITRSIHIINGGLKSSLNTGLYSIITLTYNTTPKYKKCSPCVLYQERFAIIFNIILNFSKFRKAYWELNGDLCDQVKEQEPFNNTKILLDMIDTHTFDFLTGKQRIYMFIC